MNKKIYSFLLFENILRFLIAFFWQKIVIFVSISGKSMTQKLLEIVQVSFLNFFIVIKTENEAVKVQKNHDFDQFSIYV